MAEVTEQTEAEARRSHRKSRQGVVVSDKMHKSIVVQIDRLVMHRVYKKYVRQRSKYTVHDERNEAQVGDTVLIEECRPLSRQKRWRLKSITEKAV